MINRSDLATRHGDVPDLDALPLTAACTTKQVALLSGYSVPTLKLWRYQASARGPKVSTVGGRPRYLVRDLRAWMGLGNV